MTETITARERRSTLTIECPDRCPPEAGCDHGGDGWRTSVTLPADTSIDYARVIMERHAEQYPLSGPYRLVYRSEVTTKTMEVVE